VKESVGISFDMLNVPLIYSVAPYDLQTSCKMEWEGCMTDMGKPVATYCELRSYNYD
jgi:hypothetical protein